MKRLVVALLMACTSARESPASDAAIEEEDVADALPTLDPSKCGTVTGDETPMVIAPESPSTLMEKLFPFHVAFAKLPPASTELAAIASAREDKWKAGDLAAATWTEAEATTASELVAKIVPKPFVDALRSSGLFNAHLTLADQAFVQRVVKDELLAASNAIGAFAPELTAEQKTKALAFTKTSPIAYHDTLAIAVAVLEGADRAQAAQYEPLLAGENAAAAAAIKTIDWKKFPFAAMVIPGLGPTDLKTPLAEGGQIRCELAIARYRAGLAPLIVLSGGHVHPDRTTYSEAIEMKKYLVGKGIPASAIVVDPHARHTTTNLRNTSRLMLRYGVPGDRPVLLTSDAFQSLYMIGRPFAVRCREEIGFEPWRKLTSLSINDSCFFPSRVSFTQVPRDPRDP